MATRDRFADFKTCRDLHRSRDGDDKGLLGPSATRVEVLPEWVHVMQGVRTIEGQIAAEHQSIEELHRQHLKVQFGGERDLDAEEQAIDEASQSIARKFKLAENEVKRLDDVFRQSLGPDGGSNAELSILRNVKMCLVHELGALSKQVRDSQRNYLQALEKQKAVRDRWAGAAHQREVEARLNQQRELEHHLQQGCTQEQVDAIMLNKRLAEERDQEFQSILNNIKSLHEMFADLNTLVIEQGTLLDRIDHNMTLAHQRVVSGRKQLESAQKHQEAGTFKLCVLLLVVMIMGFALALMIKIAT